MTTNKLRVLISGATGYFGQICCKYFTSKGWDVVKATRHSGADVFFDLDKPESFANKKVNFSVDLFIHAAAAHEVTCQKKPYHAIAQNVLGTKAALDFCLLNGIKQFVYLSTFHVFGNPRGLINENSTPSPLSDYGLSNLQAEEYVQMYSQKKLIKGLVLRPTNFFGVPENLEQCKRWTLVPLAFCKNAVEKEVITLKTSGHQLRNFISISDICKVIDASFFSQEHYPLLHIPGTETLSIRSLARMVQNVLKKEFNKDINIVFPENTDNCEIFQFNSLYLVKLYQPKDHLEPFIKALCDKLIKEGGTS